MCTWHCPKHPNRWQLVKSAARSKSCSIPLDYATIADWFLKAWKTKWHQPCRWDSTHTSGKTDFINKEEEEDWEKQKMVALDAKIRLLYLITILLLSCHNSNGQIDSSWVFFDLQRTVELTQKGQGSESICWSSPAMDFNRDLLPHSENDWGKSRGCNYL